MPDLLTRRGSVWHFVRRVPVEFAALDPRGIIRQSTHVRIDEDRHGRRAARVAHKMNAELERHWKMLAAGLSPSDSQRYDDARRTARSLGYDYVPNEDLVLQPIARILERFEALLAKGLAADGSARTAVLGTEKRPSFLLSQLFEEYETATRDEVRDFSADQLRIWRNGRVRAMSRFIEVVGDKPVNEITEADGIDYVEWWRERIMDDNVAAKTANKDIGQLSRMLKEMSVRRRLNLPDIFKGLRLRGEIERSRQPYEPAFVRSRFLTGDALAGLNEDARLVLMVMIETGLRPSEVVNLREATIRLNAKIPHVVIAADGRRLKTGDSAREMPLVGVALEAMKLRPKGFPRYRDKTSQLSGAVNKYLAENGLRPTKDHTVYSLRHSFKDRLVAVEAPDSLIDAMMGHKTYKPKYGRGPSLELKLKYLEKIAFPVANCPALAVQCLSSGTARARVSSPRGTTGAPGRRARSARAAP